MSLNITDAIFAQGDRYPDAVAVIDVERSVSYRALCRGVLVAAQCFREAGWKQGDTIGISLEKNPTLHIISMLTLARMGITQVCIPASDPVPLRLSRIKKFSVAGLLVDHAQNVPAGLRAPVTVVIPKWGWLANPPCTPDAVAHEDIRAPGGDSLWIINETSGTTATPKVIGISHATEYAHRRNQAPLSAHLPGERFLSFTGLRFLSALKRAIYCLSDGGTLTLPNANLSSEQLLQWINLHHVGYITCVPLHLHQLLRDVRTDSPCMPSVRILRAGTAALPVSAIADVRKRLTPNLYISYGSTETGSIATATPAMLDADLGTVGLPLAGIKFEIVDNHGKPLSRGMLGHVRVRGRGIVTSYLHATETGQRNAFQDGWFYPGDVAIMNSDGLVFLKGRSDEVMNFDGILVGPAEIESVLRQHPSVKEVAAFALPSRDHQDIPAAAIVSDQPLSVAELTRFCTQRMGVRAPRVLLRFDEIPKNAMGKILRRRVTELAIQQLKKNALPHMNSASPGRLQPIGHVTAIRSQLPECVWPAIPGKAGAEALALQYQLERSQWLSPEKLRLAQFGQLQHMLTEAFRNINYWRDTLKQVGFEPGRVISESQFASLPILDRLTVQRLGDKLVNPKVPAAHRKVYKGSTSGSTGTPVTFYQTDVSQQFWRALTLREHLWQQRDFSGKLAAIRSNVDTRVGANWGSATAGVLKTGPACTLNIRADIDEQLDWLVKQNPDYLLTHPSNLKALATRAMARGIALPRLKQLRTFGEILTDDTREQCRQAWNVEIADGYSSEEAGCIASQCERGAYHVQSENLLVEIVDEHGAACRPGDIGRVLITTLHNFAMPLIRYEIGDYAQGGEPCACGRGLPVLQRIMGRVRNMLQLPDGTQHWPSFPEERWVGIAPIQQLQVVQKSLDTVILKVKAARPLSASETARLIDTFRDTLKFPHHIAVEPVENIPRGRNAKFEDFISEIA